MTIAVPASTAFSSGPRRARSRDGKSLTPADKATAFFLVPAPANRGSFRLVGRRAIITSVKGAGVPDEPNARGIVTRSSPLAFATTVQRLLDLIESKGLKLFALVDHSGEAARAGLTMNETKLLVFGSPAAGTPVMAAAPLAALDLPLKTLVWADSDGGVWISYNDPEYLRSRYDLSEDLAGRLAGVGPLVEAATAT